MTGLNATELLLEPPEVAELTGIKGGYKGKSRNARQIAQLRAMKIPHYVTAAGRPAVVRAIIQGGTAVTAPAPEWEPQVS